MLRVALLLALSLTGCKEPLVVQSYLAMVNISPASGAAGVDVDTQIIATFSEELDPDTVDAQTVYVEDQDMMPVVVTVTYTEESQSILITPESALSEDTRYTVTFSQEIAGLASGPLGSAISSDFSTEGWAPSDELPIADAGGDQSGTVGTEVALDGRGSSDPEGQNLTYAWRIVSAPSGSTASLTWDDRSQTGFTPDLPGKFMAGLVVNDGSWDSSEDFIAIEVSSADPEDTGDSMDTGDLSGAAR